MNALSRGAVSMGRSSGLYLRSDDAHGQEVEWGMGWTIFRQAFFDSAYEWNKAAGSGSCTGSLGATTMDNNEAFIRRRKKVGWLNESPHH